MMIEYLHSALCTLHSSHGQQSGTHLKVGCLAFLAGESVSCVHLSRTEVSAALQSIFSHDEMPSSMRAQPPTSRQSRPHRGTTAQWHGRDFIGLARSSARSVQRACSVQAIAIAIASPAASCQASLRTSLRTPLPCRHIFHPIPAHGSHSAAPDQRSLGLTSWWRAARRHGSWPAERPPTVEVPSKWTIRILFLHCQPKQAFSRRSTPPV